jgi:hypothetical protein
VVPRDRCCDVEGTGRRPPRLGSNGDCEPFGSRVSDAGSVAALPSSPCQCFVDNIPVLGSIDGFQGDRGIRRSVDRLETRHQPRSPASETTVSWRVVDPFERSGLFLSMSSQALAVGHAVQIHFLCRPPRALPCIAHGYGHSALLSDEEDQPVCASTRGRRRRQLQPLPAEAGKESLRNAGRESRCCVLGYFSDHRTFKQGCVFLVTHRSLRQAGAGLNPLRHARKTHRRLRQLALKWRLGRVPCTPVGTQTMTCCYRLHDQET